MCAHIQSIRACVSAQCLWLCMDCGFVSLCLQCVCVCVCYPWDELCGKLSLIKERIALLLIQQIKRSKIKGFCGHVCYNLTFLSHSHWGSRHNLALSQLWWWLFCQYLMKLKRAHRWLVKMACALPCTDSNRKRLTLDRFVWQTFLNIFAAIFCITECWGWVKRKIVFIHNVKGLFFFFFFYRGDFDIT